MKNNRNGTQPNSGVSPALNRQLDHTIKRDKNKTGFLWQMLKKAEEIQILKLLVEMVMVIALGLSNKS